MAVIWNKHGGEPVNDGERRVITQLADELPDDFTIVPDIQIPYRHHQVDEIDALIITPFAVIIVEIKDLKGRVVFDEQRHRVDGETRPNPISQNGYRSRRLKGKLVDSSPALRNIWVADQVVLAREPQMLSINDVIASKVVLLANAAARLSDPSQILPHRPNREPVDVDLVLAALGLIRRRSTSETFGNYRTTSLVEETEDGRLYMAVHRITEKPVSLRVHPIDRFLPRSEQKAARERALKAFKARALLDEKTGHVPQVLGPTEAFYTEGGDVVTVSPLDTGVQLDSLGGTDAWYPVEVRLAIVRDVAAALNAAHGPNISHRRISPACIHVDLHQEDLRSVVARLGDWDRADLGQVERPPRATSIHSEGNPFGAPEVADGSLRSWLPADLWSLARTVQWIWSDFGSTTGLGPLPPRLANLVETLLRTDPGERSASALDVFEVAEALLTDKLVDQSDTESATGLDDLVEGDELDSRRYVIVRVIGAGATSRVFEIKDLWMKGERTALKLFRSGFSRDVTFLLAEINALLAVVHPNVVRVRDAVFIPEGRGLKMELLTGPNLRDFTEGQHTTDHRTILEWFDKILDALEALHREGVFHRDIKPENLIVVEDGHELVLVDFGLASGPEAAIGGGTPAYRPVGVAADAADPALDLFALTITLHEALTRIHPFGGGGACSWPVMLEPGLPEPLLTLFSQALHENADQRFGSAREFRSALTEVRQELGYLDPIEKPGSSPIPDDDPVDGEILHLGPKVDIRVLPGSERRTETSTPAGEEEVEATIVKATIEAEPGIRLDVELCRADNGETWIRAVDAYRSPERIQRLVRGLRAGVRPIPESDDKRFIELRLAKIIDDPNWPRIRKVPKAELDKAAGADIDELLRSLGASGVATREDTWGDTSNRKTDLCVSFDIDDAVVPLAAYALTRVAPLVVAPTARSELVPGSPKPSSPPVVKAAQENVPHGPSRPDHIVALCKESVSLWNRRKRTYDNPSEGERARAIAKEIEMTRRTLADELPEHLVGSDSQLLRSPRIERQQFKSGQWRSYTWIDLLYQTDTDGNPIDYDFLARSDRGAHLFRLWFTACGVGIGIRPAGRKVHQTRTALTSGLPAGYPDRQPLGSHKHESHHELYLKGRPGQINQYFALWRNSFTSDTEFFRQVADAWSEVGPLLNLYRC